MPTIRRLSIVAVITHGLLNGSPVAASERAEEACRRHFDDARYIEAAAPCRQAAEAGDAASQTLLGELYDGGLGVEPSAELTAKWWGAAVAQGHPAARNLLALKYYYGGTVFGPEPGWSRDYGKAMSLWRPSAEAGEATSQFMLGEMYRLGQGVPVDRAEAYAWFHLALGGGYKLATDALQEMSRVITPEERREGARRLGDYRLRFAANPPD